MGTRNPDPGWYPDPSGQAGQAMERWWGGSGWSGQTRSYTAPEAAPIAASPTYAQQPSTGPAEKPPHGSGDGKSSQQALPDQSVAPPEYDEGALWQGEGRKRGHVDAIDIPCLACGAIEAVAAENSSFRCSSGHTQAFYRCAQCEAAVQQGRIGDPCPFCSSTMRVGPVTAWEWAFDTYSHPERTARRPYWNGQEPDPNEPSLSSKTHQAPFEGAVRSPDGTQWWDGAVWRPVAPEPPASALRSPDGTHWWDGLKWVAIASPPPYSAPPRDTGGTQQYPSDGTPNYRAEPPRGFDNGGIFATWLFLGPLSLIFAWYSTRISAKAKWIWTSLVAAQIAVIVIIIAVAIRPGTGGVDTSAVQQFVTGSIPGSVTGVAGAPSDETVSVSGVTCVQATGNTWTCDATYQVSAPSESITQNFSATLDVTCDSTGSCSYPAFQPIPTQ